MDSDRASSPSRGLGTVLRVVTAGAGAILVSAGGAAVFLTDNGVGSGVLIAAGVLFGLIGIGGRLPSSIKLGDNEITMPIVEAVSRRIESASPEEASELVPNVVAALPGSDRPNIESYAAGQIFADKVALALRLAVAESGANYIIDRPTRDGGVDFELHGAKTIGIIVRYSQAHNPIAARKTVEAFARRTQGLEYDVFLLVTNMSGIIPLHGPTAPILSSRKTHILVGSEVDELAGRFKELLGD